LVTVIGRDGMMNGPDLALLTRIREEAGVPVTAAGGVGSLDHLTQLAAVGFDEVIVGRALFESRFTLPQALDSVRSR
jgi:phosphoribosylformimino-5-aminoimidazole carboxamide ribonucleotide (ProFAR) isomerase